MAADEAHRAFLEDFMRHRQFFKTIMTHERTLTQAWIVHVLYDLVDVVVGFHCLEYEQTYFAVTGSQRLGELSTERGEGSEECGAVQAQG